MNDQPTVQVNNSGSADHDLLIKLDTKFDIFGRKLDDLSVNLSSRVEILEKLAIQSQDIHRGLEKADVDEKAERIHAINNVQQTVVFNQTDIAFFKKWFWRLQGIWWLLYALAGYYLLKHFGGAL